ncbi:SWIM-type domain-containing protein [Trichonephila clavata]|uniref:SWIM-type domain-containing protein n=2 Tax=Trichonephila clavata TaxID=2740835 RepID=A0A8X6GGS5_TRICU|nr:SWIM-type domain-containing protein [Trichonephila clavata]
MLRVNDEFINPFDKLKEKVPFYESIGTTVKFHDDHLWAVLLVTPLMKKNHPLSSSKEIIFIDSTASCETSSSTITIMLSATKVGALPLAVMIHASQCMQNYINAFELLKMNFPQCFGGQDHPDIFMSDDSSAEKGALAAVWPEAKQLLCHFHVAQAEWRWLFSHKMMEQEKKSTFMKLFQAVQVMYADSEENLLDAENNLLLKCKNYPDYVKRFRNFLARKKEWILLFRKDLITRNNNTNNFSEASIRILKDVILSRTRAFNVIALCEFFLGVWEDYFTKKLFEFATSRRLSVTVFYDKIRKKSSNFTENDLKDLSNNLFKINSGEHTYIIKTDVGVCSCPSGLTGAFCKHQCALMELKKIRLPNAPPVTPEDKHELALLALGPKCPPKDFFCNFKNQLSSATVESNAFELPIEQETDSNAHSNNEGQIINAKPITNFKREEILNELKRITDVVKIANLSEESGDRLIRNLQKIQTVKDLKNIYVLKKQIFRGKIKVQPTSIARRKSLIRSSRRIPFGRPLKTEKKSIPREKEISAPILI